MSLFIIYGLFDPRDGLLRYIGKSTRGIARPLSHVHPGALKRDRWTPRGKWVNDLVAQNLKPQIVILEEGSDPVSLNDLERFWIASIRSTGAHILNRRDGGDGSAFGKRSPEWRENISRAQRGVPRPYARNPRSPEVIAKISAAHRGVVRPDRQKQGHPLWDEKVDTERDILNPIRMGKTTTRVAIDLKKSRSFVLNRLRLAGTSVKQLRPSLEHVRSEQRNLAVSMTLKGRTKTPEHIASARLGRWKVA